MHPPDVDLLVQRQPALGLSCGCGRGRVVVVVVTWIVVVQHAVTTPVFLKNVDDLVLCVDKRC